MVAMNFRNEDILLYILTFLRCLKGKEKRKMFIEKELANRLLSYPTNPFRLSINV